MIFDQVLPELTFDQFFYLFNTHCKTESLNQCRQIKRNKNNSFSILLFIFDYCLLKVLVHFIFMMLIFFFFFVKARGVYKVNDETFCDKLWRGKTIRLEYYDHRDINTHGRVQLKHRHFFFLMENVLITLEITSSTTDQLTI